MEGESLGQRVGILSFSIRDVGQVLEGRLLELGLELVNEVRFAEEVDGTSDDHLLALTLPYAFLPINERGSEHTVSQLTVNALPTAGQRVEVVLARERDVALIFVVQLLARQYFCVIRAEAMGSAEELLHGKHSVEAALGDVVSRRLDGHAARVLRIYESVFQRLLRFFSGENLNFGQLRLNFCACRVDWRLNEPNLISPAHFQRLSVLLVHRDRSCALAEQTNVDRARVRQETAREGVMGLGERVRKLAGL